MFNISVNDKKNIYRSKPVMNVDTTGSSGGGGIGVQSDWSQNDSTAADYVKNRPFYVGDPVETEIVNVSLDFRQSGSIYAYYGTAFAGESFEIGQTYQVIFDDSTYDCTAFLLEGLGCLGNPSVIGVQIEGSADVPFFIARNPETSIVNTTMDGVSHSLKIIAGVREINKIDKKYIPTLDYLDKKNPTGVGSFGMNRKINSDIGEYSVALGEGCVASGASSISAGSSAKATELTAQAFGYGTEANARFSHAEGCDSKVSIDASEKVDAREPEAGAGRYGHAEGFATLVTGGIGAHAEGALTLASGDSSHAEGYKTTASERYSHAEGESTTASGRYSHAEGCTTTASGYQSHAEGYKTTASGDQSHAEGYEATASGRYSHAEGKSTTASKDGSHAEGNQTIASGRYSHAEGTNTIASSDYQHVQGHCNVEDSSGIYAHIVGNGANMDSRSNAHTLDWSGNAWFAGTVEGTAIIVKSSTAGSSKRFKITVDDSGTISATEVT